MGQFHAIGFEGIVQEGNEKYVHHLVLKGYNLDDCGGGCFDDDDDAESSSSNSSVSVAPSGACANATIADVYAWAPGAPALATPDDVGFRFGTGGFISIGVETHYDNPDGDAGVVDSSGTRVYYTEELRAMDAGILQLADPVVALEGTQLPDGKSRFSFSCPASCTEDNFEVGFS